MIKKNGAIVLFGSEPFSSYLRMSNIKWYKYDWVWDKVRSCGHLVSKKRPLQQTECISVFNCVGHYYPQMIKLPVEKIRYDKRKEYKRTEIIGGKNTMKPTMKEKHDTGFPKTLITFLKDDNSLRQHPTQKPVKLLEYLVRTYTDNCMGSGSTIIACLNTKRDFIGIEKDAHYFDVARKRIEDHKKQMELSFFNMIGGDE